MRTIAAVSVGRSDWGIYRPVLSQIRDDPDLKLRLVVSGAHLTRESGHTVNEITADGFVVDHTVDMLMAADSPAGIAKSMGIGTLGFADVYQSNRPDLLLVLGDRFEMHAAALAAVPFGIPIAHIHGGEVTHGAIDDAFRHAITKYSHLHFPSTQQHADRIVQLGEEPWRVTVSGAPALDNLRAMSLLSRKQLGERLRLDLSEAPVLVTFHPVTLQPAETAAQIKEVVAALSDLRGPIIVTRPNADTHHSQITEQLEQFCSKREDVRLVSSLGIQAYFSLMREARVMIGNSSSGIIEAASFKLPVVNIGLRQAGRPRSANIIDVDCVSSAIIDAVDRACSTAFRGSLQDLRNLYGEGHAAAIITERLKSVPLDDRLLVKRFHDLSAPTTAFSTQSQPTEHEVCSVDASMGRQKL